MKKRKTPYIFDVLLSDKCIDKLHVINTDDGFFMVNKALSDILLSKDILDFLDSSGERLTCNKFFDDWFLYAVFNEEDYVYGLLKLREQEYDAKDTSPADGDVPGVTISFVPFDCGVLLECLKFSSDENRSKLNTEINRVVAYKGQRHHKTIKKYFKNPLSDGAYLVAKTYTEHIALSATDGYVKVPEHYKEILQQSVSYKSSRKLARLPRFIDELNKLAGYVVCDNEKIYIKNHKKPARYEALAILATHTGNVSEFSFAAEVEYHARYLTHIAKIKIPFFGRSVYDSAVRADMSVCDTEFEGYAPFYNLNSEIVKRQYALHSDNLFFKEDYYD